MADINPTLTAITLNLNALNTPIKRRQLAKWISNIQNQPHVICKKHTRFRDKNRVNIIESENIHNTNSSRKKDG